jgi:hypothetical protein
MTPEQLEAIEGIGPKTVEKISLAVNNYFASLEGVPAEGAAEGEVPEGENAVGESSEVASAEAAAEDITAEVPVVEEPVSAEEAALAGETESHAAGTNENEGQAGHADEEPASEEESASETKQ